MMDTGSLCRVQRESKTRFQLLCAPKRTGFWTSGVHGLPSRKHVTPKLLLGFSAPEFSTPTKFHLGQHCTTVCILSVSLPLKAQFLRNIRSQICCRSSVGIEERVSSPCCTPLASHRIQRQMILLRGRVQHVLRTLGRCFRPLLGVNN